MNRIKRAGRIVLGMAILFWFFLGVLVIVFIPFELRSMAQARDWPSRPGTITESYTLQTTSGVGRGPWFKPSIRGTYDGTGENFFITRVRYGGFTWGSGKRQSDEYVAKYPAGMKVAVFHDPNDPRETILEPDAPWDAMLILSTVGIAGFLLPFVLYFLGRAGVLKT